MSEVPPPPPPPPPGDPPAKRIRTQGEFEAQGQLVPIQEPDQVSAALQKIASHIGRPSKFLKASGLLRKLLSDGALNREQHGHLLFQALKASMKDPDSSIDPDLSRDYGRLFSAASNQPELFSGREKGQLDVYGLMAVLRNQLDTDDSFVFNRVIGRIKDSIQHLPDATEEDDELLANLKAPQPEELPAPSPAQQPPKSQPAAAAEIVEEDPFGLETLIEAPRPSVPEPARPKQPSSAWSTWESLCMKREALLACVQAAKAMYHNAWARTSVDLLVDEVVKSKDKFCRAQHATIAELAQFVQQKRVERRQGPSAREERRDKTAFEEARETWGRSTVSARGKVGTGDHKNEVWLG